ncbi:NAD(P)/FAD-dependent oxidoreductase [Micromonospora sp. NPDC050980]|uniref:flavin-containing monooxygenase n=1 Tax=Micromonospora sp. NPDC050980 TaxID=3155161 RepID=UPI0033ED2CFC
MLTSPSRPAELRVAVIGAGFGGIAAAIELRRRGFSDVTVFERSDGPGGTWWDNRYPGAETDAASHLYSYSFAPYDWSRTHVRQPELQRYLEHVVDRFGIRPLIRFRTEVRRLTWDAARCGWRLRTAAGEESFFHAVVSALGMFGKPRWPDWPGLAEFPGPVLHTAVWDDRHDLTGKRVAVVGTGSSAAQVVPTLAPSVAALTLFQRQPGWLLPKRDRDFTARERRLYRRSHTLQRLNRLRLYLLQERREWRGAFFRPGHRINTKARERALAYAREVFADRPDLMAAVTPDYPFAGKRTIVSSDFYPALRRDNVTVVPRAVLSCTPDGLVDTAGVRHRFDAIVLATGFEATEYLASIEVVGRDGRTLRETWAGEPQAYLGVLTPNFPNFFMLYGPNTNGGLIITNLERQSRFISRELSRLVRTRQPAVEVSAAANQRYNDWLQRKINATAFVQGNNYFAVKSGRVVTQWPDNATVYGALLVVLRWWGRWRTPQRRRS